MKSASSGEIASHRAAGRVVIGRIGFRPCWRLVGWIMEKRVLLVEDDASLARSIVEGLSDEGFTVAHAADGEAALEVPLAGR